MSVLDKTVSCFANYTTARGPKEIHLLTWLTSSKYATEIAQIRTIEDKAERDRVKAKLPGITPSGTFSHRSEDNLIKHSGLIQFDIDLKENQHIANYEDLKEQISKIPVIAYCGLSASGKGFWGLIPIAYPERHKEHFDAIKQDFKHYGIVIDEKPKNVASLRGYSWDPGPYFNHHAQVYNKVVFQESRIIKELNSASNSYGSDQKFTRQRVEELIRQITQKGEDITGSYQTWFEIGCSLANEFGEEGREYFHLVSQYHPDYRQGKTDRQFDYCLKHNYSFQINTFFHYCKINGITEDPRYERTGRGHDVSRPSVSHWNDDRQKAVDRHAFRWQNKPSEKYLQEMIPGCPF